MFPGLSAIFFNRTEKANDDFPIVLQPNNVNETHTLSWIWVRESGKICSKQTEVPIQVYASGYCDLQHWPLCATTFHVKYPGRNSTIRRRKWFCLCFFEWTLLWMPHSPSTVVGLRTIFLESISLSAWSNWRLCVRRTGVLRMVLPSGTDTVLISEIPAVCCRIDLFGNESLQSSASLGNIANREMQIQKDCMVQRIINILWVLCGRFSVRWRQRLVPIDSSENTMNWHCNTWSAALSWCYTSPFHSFLLSLKPISFDAVKLCSRMWLG